MTRPANLTDSLFRELVYEALDQGRKEELATEFEVAPSTVVRWATGSSRPHWRVQALVLGYLANPGLIKRLDQP